MADRTSISIQPADMSTSLRFLGYKPSNSAENDVVLTLQEFAELMHFGDYSSTYPRLYYICQIGTDDSTGTPLYGFMFVSIPLQYIGQDYKIWDARILNPNFADTIPLYCLWNDSNSVTNQYLYLYNKTTGRFTNYPITYSYENTSYNNERYIMPGNGTNVRGRTTTHSTVYILFDADVNWIVNGDPYIPPVQGATVKVNYMIPEGDYQYCKLTYKADYQPENQNDGTSIDISPSGSSVNVEGLDENQLYYFTLFTDKSESEPFPFTATPDPVPPQYRTYIDNINGIGFNWIKELEQDTATITNSDHSTFTTNMYKYYPLNKVTWYTYSHIGTDVENWGKTYFSSQTTALFVNTKIDKVEITSENDVYSCTIRKKNNSSDVDPNYMFAYDKTVTMGGIYTEETLPRTCYANFNNHSGYLSYGPNCNPWYLAGSWTTRTFTGTLVEVFEDLQKYVRNIDIYVDGELWSKAGK